jgi:uncharacterized protein YkwD
MVAENIAWGYGTNGTPRIIVRNWMASAVHKANILDPRVRELALGVAKGSPTLTQVPNSATYVALFGVR